MSAGRMHRGGQATTRLLEMLTDGGDTPLDRGALLIAQHAKPELDADEHVRVLDRLADRVAEPTLDGVVRLLFRDLTFRGDGTNYYDPRNSFLDEVLRRRMGQPITLSVVLVEVARRVHVPVDMVGMPGHFLVRDRVLPDVFVDPFNGGAKMDIRGCEMVFRQLAGPKAPFLESYLEPVRAPEVLGRIVANLVNAYRRNGDMVGLGWAASLRSQMPRVSPAEKIQLGQSLATAGRQHEAAALIESAAAILEGDEAEQWHREAGRLRASTN